MVCVRDWQQKKKKMEERKTGGEWQGLERRKYLMSPKNQTEKRTTPLLKNLDVCQPEKKKERKRGERRRLHPYRM